MGVSNSVLARRQATKEMETIMVQLPKLPFNEWSNLLKSCPSLVKILPLFGYSQEYNGLLIQSDMASVNNYTTYLQLGIQSTQMIELFKNQAYESINLIVTNVLINQVKLCHCLVRSTELCEYLIANLTLIPYTQGSNRHCSPIPENILNLCNYNYVLEGLADYCIESDNVVSFVKVIQYYTQLVPHDKYYYNQCGEYIANNLVFKMTNHKFLLAFLDTGYQLFQEGTPSCELEPSHPNYQFLWDWYYNHIEHITIAKRQTSVNVIVNIIWYSRYKGDDLVAFAKKAIEKQNVFVISTLESLLFNHIKVDDNRKIYELLNGDVVLYNYLFERYYQESYSVWLKEIDISTLFKHFSQHSKYDQSLLVLCKTLLKMRSQGQIKNCNKYVNYLQLACLNQRLTQLNYFHQCQLFSHNDWLEVYRNYPQIQRHIEGLMELDSPMFRNNKQTRS